MPDSADPDIRWMRRALRLAAQGFTPPNPMVGCVLVRDGQVVGEGFHVAAGMPHAEVNAIRAAGGAARGATAYVTLEPCCHRGRTPPCTEALSAAGVLRVAAAIVDPNPRMAGKGLEALRRAGIQVVLGPLAAEASRLNEAFLHFHSHGSPFVTLKAAMTVDGKIATRSGDARWITGSSARTFVHKLRAQSGAVVVGVGTLLADDAALTARLPHRQLPRQPLRIVVDSHLRTPPDARALQLAAERPEERPLIIATTEAAAHEHERVLARPGVEILRLPAEPEGRVDLRTLCKRMAEREIISLLVEGGAELNASFLAAHLAHKALIFIAPKIVGGRTAPTPVGGAGLETLEQAYRLESVRLRRFGKDIAMEGRLCYPEQGPLTPAAPGTQ